jgi:hypothetical protein
MWTPLVERAAAAERLDDAIRLRLLLVHQADQPVLEEAGHRIPGEQHRSGGHAGQAQDPTRDEVGELVGDRRLARGAVPTPEHQDDAQDDQQDAEHQELPVARAGRDPDT